MEKTNVMRILDQKKATYQSYSYAGMNGAQTLSGGEVARALGEDPRRVFKTLVTVGKSGVHYVFMIPAEDELDLKKAARHVGEKSIEMIKAKELLPLTGYIHGGCSPIGMKKPFRTVIHKTAQDFPRIFFSAGKIGCQVEMPLETLRKVYPVETGEIVVSDESAESAEQ